ncbi:hypothetical protein [Runella salmonicolor]|uniref:Uncharacterized protein n=1 Tax=Runella salmonicolor TaxID=2950278 RepID=A0ABT1FWU9_9BACT|nr:hypothetical protein [Runella salmonicolor]MCP1386251.1 hypothetical protein [Runella salmonicolor]
MSKARSYPTYKGNLVEDLRRGHRYAHKFLYDFLLERAKKYEWQTSKDQSQKPEDRAMEAWSSIFKSLNRFDAYGNFLAEAELILKRRNIDYFRQHIKPQNELLKKQYNLDDDEIKLLGGVIGEDDSLLESVDEEGYNKGEHNTGSVENHVKEINMESDYDDFQPTRGKSQQPLTSIDDASFGVRIEELFKVFWKDLAKTNVPIYKKLSFWLNNVQELKNKEIVIVLKSLIGSESAEVTENDVISSTCLFEVESSILLQINEIIEGLRKVNAKSVDGWLESAVDQISFLIFEEHKINKKEVVELLKTVHEKSHELNNTDITTTNVSHWANQCKIKLAEITILK